MFDLPSNGKKLFGVPPSATEKTEKTQENKQESAGNDVIPEISIATLKKNTSIFGSTDVLAPKESLFGGAKPPAPGGLFTIPEKPKEEQLESKESSDNLGNKVSLFD